MERCPDPDTLLELLSNRRRRHLIRCLRRHGPMTLADLADEIAVLEGETTIDGVPAGTVAEVYDALHRVHLPKLSEANIAVYDQESDMVSLRDWSGEINGGDPDDSFGCTEFTVPREDDRSVPDACGITVELRPETIEMIHRTIRRDGSLSPRASYDETIRAVFEEAGNDRRDDATEGG